MLSVFFFLKKSLLFAKSNKKKQMNKYRTTNCFPPAKHKKKGKGFSFSWETKRIRRLLFFVSRQTKGAFFTLSWQVPTCQHW